jgi:23S rRNA (cytidine1920-2'-O)/16S rRNA (cytidine1409-2'-O)-methyltransferase
MSMTDPACPYVGRGGLKLRHALDEFAIDPSGMICADFGANVGGFTDCLLHAGASRIIAVDTGYGTLDWKLRNDPRVTVMERTNALHAELPADLTAGVDLIAIDMGWTPQRHCVPAALRWLSRGEAARIVTLIKPHYEASDAGESHLLHKGVLAEDQSQRTLERVVQAMGGLGVRVLGCVRSPVVGGKGKKNATGNIEYLAALARG